MLVPNRRQLLDRCLPASDHIDDQTTKGISANPSRLMVPLIMTESNCWKLRRPVDTPLHVQSAGHKGRRQVAARQAAWMPQCRDRQFRSRPIDRMSSTRKRPSFPGSTVACNRSR
jgi:hypothetical protein